ncbi:acyl-CoA dehydrogenase family protein [uncultured Jatrophihabitans sp.]|uniref:acyl-CoA dehydrogenase family protein n=1 Tax=uncultured Jatrophihabitans sp. TaxID=1610747 RepID=UPI0035CB538D
MTAETLWMPSSTAGSVEDTPAQADFRRRVREFLDANAERIAHRGWSRHTDPDAFVKAREFQGRLFAAGLAGITYPKQFGGAGLGVVENLIWLEESAGFHIPSNRLMLGLGMCGPTILAIGSDELKDRYLPRLLRGDDMWCQLLSEPGAGSDLGAVSVRAVAEGGNFVVTGQKVWNSAAQFADMGVLIARTGTVESRHRGLTMLAVDMRTPGIEVRPIRQINGGAEFNEVFFDGARVPAANVIGEVDGGWAAVITMLMNERVALSGAEGVQTLDLDPLVELARRTGLDADPVFRDKFAKLYTNVVTIQLLGDRVRSALRAGQTPGGEGSIGKLKLSQSLRERAELMLEAAGPVGVAWPAEAPDEQRWSRELLVFPGIALGGGTDQIQRNVISERLLGLPREPQNTRSTA